jgi:sarcosine/dimethylglycine N-methyltransferase
MSTAYSEVVETARAYYNSCDADTFYHQIWGGEDIHIGLYDGAETGIFQASQKTVEAMARKLTVLRAGARLLDLGSGYAGAARYLARTYGCLVTALNLSETQNERARRLNRAQGLENWIEVVDGSFEEIPATDQTYDALWSQDAFLHSGKRQQVLSEAARVLKPGGELVFTDPMQADNCPEGVLQPILDRIHLESLGSPGFYRRGLLQLGFQDLGFEDLTHQLVAHYSRVLAETESREVELSAVVNPEYIARMKQGLRHWIEGGQRGYLAWGIFHFRKKA